MDIPLRIFRYIPIFRDKLIANMCAVYMQWHREHFWKVNRENKGTNTSLAVHLVERTSPKGENDQVKTSRGVIT